MPLVIAVVAAIRVFGVRQLDGIVGYRRHGTCRASRPQAPDPGRPWLCRDSHEHQLRGAGSPPRRVDLATPSGGRARFVGPCQFWRRRARSLLSACSPYQRISPARRSLLHPGRYSRSIGVRSRGPAFCSEPVESRYVVGAHEQRGLLFSPFSSGPGCRSLSWWQLHSVVLPSTGFAAFSAPTRILLRPAAAPNHSCPSISSG